MLKIKQYRKGDKVIGMVTVQVTHRIERKKLIELLACTSLSENVCCDPPQDELMDNIRVGLVAFGQWGDEGAGNTYNIAEERWAWAYRQADRLRPVKEED